MPKKRTKEDYERVQVESRAELCAWLEANHGRDEGIWLITFKKHVKDKWLPWDEIVREALCFGWIDSQLIRVDDDRVMRLFTPRRPGSIWSAVNKRHIEELLAEGLMRPPGQAKIDRAVADGSWTFLDDIEALIVPPDLAAALATSPAAQAGYDAFANSIKKQTLYFVKSAKREDTRAKRIATVVEQAADGKPAM